MMTIDSPVWDIRDCAPVYTAEQIGAVQAAGRSTVALWERFFRFNQTADIFDAICDGKFFAFDFERMVREMMEDEK